MVSISYNIRKRKEWLCLNKRRICQKWGRRVIGISGFLIWSKTLMELIFNPSGEFQWSLEGPVSQIHSPHLQAGAPRIFSDLLRSVLMLKRERGLQKATGSYCTYSSLVKLQPWFLSLRLKSCLWAKLRPWCLSLQWNTWPWAGHSDDDVGNIPISPLGTPFSSIDGSTHNLRMTKFQYVNSSTSELQIKNDNL